MNQKMLKLAAEFLETASHDVENHGCNDWEFPDDWSWEERRDFATDIVTWNVNGRQLTSEEQSQILAFARQGPPDFMVISFLASELAKMAEAK